MNVCILNKTVFVANMTVLVLNKAKFVFCMLDFRFSDPLKQKFYKKKANISRI